MHPLVSNYVKKRQRQRVEALVVGTEISLNLLDRLSIELSARFIASYGDELFPHGIFLTKNFQKLDSGITVLAGRKLKRARYNYDINADGSFDFFEDSKQAALFELHAEFKHDFNRLDQMDFCVLPYIMIEVSSNVDPSTFDPVLNFWTTYATVSKEIIAGT